MPLIVEKPAAAFDLSQVQTGYLLYAKHDTWEKGRAGFITSATEKQLIIQYHPGIGNVTNHFFLPISEVIAGEWKIRWSTDLSEVFAYNIKIAEEEQEKKDESGGTDL